MAEEGRSTPLSDKLVYGPELEVGFLQMKSTQIPLSNPARDHTFWAVRLQPSALPQHGPSNRQEMPTSRSTRVKLVSNFLLHKGKKEY